MRAVTVSVFAAWLVACAQNGPNGAGDRGADPTITTVYTNRGAAQCEHSGLSPQDSATILAAAGIDVLSTSCGFQTGIAFPAVCGAGTPDILIHEIRSVNLPDAEALGYHRIATLSDPDNVSGYQLTECTEPSDMP